MAEIRKYHYSKEEYKTSKYQSSDDESMSPKGGEKNVEGCEKKQVWII